MINPRTYYPHTVFHDVRTSEAFALSDYVDATGLAAGFFVILAFYMQDARNLRVCAIVSNLLFITYGAALTLWPILILHATLLPLNVVRLCQLIRRTELAIAVPRHSSDIGFRHRP